MGSARQHYDVIVVGGGHNGLTAAAYLSRAGRSVLVLERLPHVGGAAVSARSFPGHPVEVSRYAYLAALPPQLVTDLELDLKLRPRATGSYTPLIREGRHTGLLIERPEGAATRASFRVLTGGTSEYEAWRAFDSDVQSLARVVGPTLLGPVPYEKDIRAEVDPRVWTELVATPLGQVLEKRFEDDAVRGLLAVDGMIGTLAGPSEPSLAQNRAFLHHAVGTGEWLVPVGGMGAVSNALERAAYLAGTDIQSSSGVSAIHADTDGAEVTWQDIDGTHTATARFVLADVAPWVLQILLGSPDDLASKPQGSQLKINLLVERLPRLRSGINPNVAFAGTVHIGQSYPQLEKAHAESAAGQLPELLPGELFCHSLTDPSVLGDLAADGIHLLSYLALCVPGGLFEADPEGAKDEITRRAFSAIDQHLVDSLATCLATDAYGQPCVEVKTPPEIEAELAMPGGHIYHGDLEWPWASNRARLDTPAEQWGVHTHLPSVLLCGSGARRAGGVSGIGGHNAAHAVLASA